MQYPSLSRFGKITVAISVAALTACGGGGGGGSDRSGGDSAFFGGIYRGALYKTVVDCFGRDPLPGQFDLNMTVNQDGARVVGDQGALVYEGQTTGGDSFRVYNQFVSDNGCLVTTAVDMDNISGGNAEAILAVDVTCSGVSCKGGYSGTVTRDNGRDATEAPTTDPAAIAEALIGAATQE